MSAPAADQILPAVTGRTSQPAAPATPDATPRRAAPTVARAIEAAGGNARGGWQHAARAVMRAAVARVGRARGLPEPQWDDGPDPASGALLDGLGDISSWGAVELGAVYEAVLDAAPAHDGEPAHQPPGSQRKAAGAWYTPPEAAAFLTRFALTAQIGDDPAQALQTLALDPACGTGVFLLAAAREIAALRAALLTGIAEPPPEAVRIVLPSVMSECVFGNDADAVAVDLAKATCWLEIGGLRPITWMDDNITCGNTLAGTLPKPLADRLTGPRPLVILGNPPYNDKAGGLAPWIETRRRSGEALLARPSLDEFRSPGNGHLDYNLSSLYVYFWRWALWQALETRRAPGAVAFITPSSYLTGKAFGGMRAHMRRVADHGWIIDLTPEGHQPNVATRIFPGVQQPICMAILTGGGDPNPDQPSQVRYIAVTGNRADKLAQLHALISPASGQPAGRNGRAAE